MSNENPPSQRRLGRHEKVSEVVARDIAREITEKDLRPGDLLGTEAALLDKYGVGRGTLREALRLLEVQELLAIRMGAGGGPTVGAVDPAALGRTLTLFFQLARVTYDAIADTMLIINPLLAEQAARNANPVQAKELLTEVLKREHQHNLEPTVLFSISFHRLVQTLSGNEPLALIGAAIDTIWTHHVVTALDLKTLGAEVVPEHTDLARAIWEQKPARAAQLMTAHTHHMIQSARRQVPGIFDMIVTWR